ncbi:broad specificity phosphatase PhoE [Paenibacillus shirakamiensis]|uniref:Broad specificity phosphatase PhoE n=1 Tax=Paenibacillus shirakamiensis TaxID=1265935 RepID=A0ABS4JIF5_9BACL|nr:histidine phosphatase family protein [Paenibacillus shirakamiensis]MBP2001472.1 broad specificity phosphatase PhoE [Paenibacillus shirakamiensis]
MSIGLVRHFKVLHPPTGAWMTGKQFDHWVEGYNQAEIDTSSYTAYDHIKWDVCLSSDLYRAAKTATFFHTGSIEQTERLREVDMKGVGPAKLRLPYSLWLVAARIAWYYSHPSQPEGRGETEARAAAIISQIEEDYRGLNVLVVSHGGIMKSLTRELFSRGYQGDRFIRPPNGKLYIYNK